MTRGLKILLVVLIVLVGVLAVTVGFFYAKNMALEKKVGSDSSTLSPSTKNTDADEEATTATTTAAPNPSASTSSVTEPAVAGDRPSAPTDTYTVAAGDTLSIIGSKLDISWPTLAEANGLSEEDANKIKVGQVLIVPKNNQISYTINTAKAAELQEKISGGKDTFRLSPADTAKSDAPPAYGLAVTDTYTQKTVDAAAGTAIVTGTHNGKNYEIKLSQPVTKGDKGIWAIESIKLVR